MKILCEQEILTLVRGAKVGKEKEIEKLIEYYTPYIKTKCGKYNIHGFEYEDLVSEGVKTLLKCVDSFKEGENSFSKYYFRALSNELNYLLRKSYYDEALGIKIYSGQERYEEVDVTDLLWKEEITEMVKEYIMELNGVERTVMEEIYYRGKSMAEIARKLKYPFYKVQHIRNLEIKKIRNNIVGAV